MAIPVRSSRWEIAEADAAAVETLARRLRISPVVARVLVGRGFTEVTEARAFLNPSLNDLAEPDRLADVGKAADRIHRAVLDRERIVIYGDYDVDGITAAALLWHLLALAHTPVSIYIPHRTEEGYGVNAEAVEELARRGTQLLLTVDSGISAVDELALARGRGIDCIVTDHHEPGDRLPEAVAVVNPKRRDSDYPYPHLSGVGVAFKLAWAVAQRFSPGHKVSPEMRAFLLDALGLVALGTVADVVPLIGENRVMTHFGLQALGAVRLPGLRALLDVSGVDPRAVNAHHIAFQVAPRLNAAGRISHADLAVELLTTADTARAGIIAQELERQNRERQRIEGEILDQALGALAALPDAAERRSVVLADPRWHAGIIGIVASRLVGATGRPVILIALDRSGGRDTAGPLLAQGSGRSIPGFDLYAALHACAERLVSYGGHEQAAGLRLKPDDVPWFVERFETYCREKVTDDLLRPQVGIDAEVAFADVTAALMQELDRLAPFGQGNPKPVLASRGVRVCGQPRRMGNAGKHLGLHLRQGETTHRAVGFDMGEQLADIQRRGPVVDVAYRLGPDRYGQDLVTLLLRDITFPA